MNNTNYFRPVRNTEVDTATARKKIAADIAAFEKRGGVIERLEQPSSRKNEKA